MLDSFTSDENQSPKAGSTAMMIRKFWGSIANMASSGKYATSATVKQHPISTMPKKKTDKRKSTPVVAQIAPSAVPLISTPAAKLLSKDDKQIIQQYINRFRSNYTPHLLSNVSLYIKAVPYDQGVVLEIDFSQESNHENIETHIRRDVQDAFDHLHFNIASVLKGYDLHTYQTAVAEKKMVFSGTAMLGSDDKLYIVKDYASDQWTPAAAQKDVSRILEAAYN